MSTRAFDDPAKPTLAGKRTQYETQTTSHGCLRYRSVVFINGIMDSNVPQVSFRINYSPRAGTFGYGLKSSENGCPVISVPCTVRARRDCSTGQQVLPHARMRGLRQECPLFVRGLWDTYKEGDGLMRLLKEFSRSVSGRFHKRDRERIPSPTNRVTRINALKFRTGLYISGLLTQPCAPASSRTTVNITKLQRYGAVRSN